MGMMISLRIDDQEGSLIRKYAELHGITLSDLFRQSVLARMEDEMDLTAYRAAMAAHRADRETLTLDEMEKELTKP